MRAAVYHKPGDISIEERPLPQVHAGDVLLRVRYCGVCGTDLHLVMDGWGRPESIPGHEYSGIIVAVGDGVDDWHIGQAVVAQPTSSCGQCKYCLVGRPSLCLDNTDIGMDGYQGAFAEYKSVAAKDLLLVPEGLGLREAALCEPLAVALHGITRSEVTPDMRVLVSGAGPIGLLILAVLQYQGLDDIVVCEPLERRRKRALQVGASTAVSPRDLAIPEHPMRQVKHPYDVVYECSGKAGAIELALGNLARGGKIVLMGTGLDAPKLDAIRVILSEISVTGAYNYDENGFETAMQLLAKRALPVEYLIEPNDVPLEGLLEHMQALVAGELAGKVMIEATAV